MLYIHFEISDPGSWSNCEPQQRPIESHELISVLSKCGYDVVNTRPQPAQIIQQKT